MTIKLLGANDATGSNHAITYLQMFKFTAVATGNMTEYKVRSNVAGNIKYALYADSSGEPGALIQSMGEQTCSIGVNTLIFTSTPITNGTTYWLAWNLGTSGVAIYTGSTGGVRRYILRAYTLAFPNPAGVGYSADTYDCVVAGWGTTAGWANISKVNGVAAASISKMNGVAVAAISKVNGVTV